MDERPRILVIDPERNRGRLLTRRLCREGYRADCVATIEDSLASGSEAAEVVLIDLSLLCGPTRESLAEVVDRFAPERIWACPRCGARLRELSPGAGAPACCGRPMSALVVASPVEGEEPRCRATTR